MTVAENFAPLTEQELDDLGAFLVSGAAPAGTMALDALDGFITALVAGPVVVLPSVWLPRVFAGSELPVDETQVARILRHANYRHAALSADPDAYQPILSEVVWRARPYADGEAWSWGFLCGVGLVIEQWQPLFDAPDAMLALEPIQLLGAEGLSAEEQELCKNPSRRARLCERLPESVATLWRFWEPFRGVVATRRLESPKTGRNDPCPCGSGRKFKKCCSA